MGDLVQLEGNKHECSEDNIATYLVDQGNPSLQPVESSALALDRARNTSHWTI